MPPRSQTILSLVAALSAAAATGCTPEVHSYIRFPNFLQPGWAHQQRFEALEHDPYPLDDMGPEVVGGRPREYQRPIPEVERARQGTASPPALPLGVPTLPVAPPVITQPPVVTGPPIVTAPPVVTTPYPTTPAQAPPFQVQQRAPY